jgi:hypothetical protein
MGRGVGTVIAGGAIGPGVGGAENAGAATAGWLGRADPLEFVARGTGDGVVRAATGLGDGRGAAGAFATGDGDPTTIDGTGVAFTRSVTARATLGPAVTPAMAVPIVTTLPMTAMPIGPLKKLTRESMPIDSHSDHRPTPGQ